MIKGDYFLKLLKPLFSILLIGFFGLLGNSFVNAAFDSVGYYYNANTNETYNFQGYTYYVSSNGNFLTTNGGSTARTFTRNPIMENRNRIYNLGWINGNLYFYDYFYINDTIQSTQGFLNKWCVVPVSSRGSDKLHNNCSFSYTLNDIKGMISNFTNYAFDVVGSVNPSWAGYDYTPLMFCFSDGENDYCVSCGVSSCPSGLTGSLDLDLGDFANISNYSWGSSPFQINGPIDIYNSGGVNIDGDYTYTYCTYGEILNQLESEGYNEYLCYGGLSDWSDYDSSSGYNVVPGTGFTLSQILSHNLQNGQTPQEWFDFWNGLYYDSQFTAMWESYPAVNRIWFDFYKNYGGDKLYFDGVREYCNIKVDLNIDLNLKYNINGTNFFGSECQKIIRAKNNGTYDSSGNIVLGVNWDGVGGLSGNKTYSDPGVFIIDMFTKLKSYIPTDKSDIGFGFLPTYIITFMLFLILFRFLSH